MKNHRAPLIAIAMAGIAAPAANATTYNETTEYPSGPGAPTNLGPFNPALDSIIGSVKSPDNGDSVLVSGTPNSAVSLQLSLYNSDPTTFLQFSISDNAGPTGPITSQVYSSPAATGGTFNFNVPADGNYMIWLSTEGGGYNYTIGVVPEPSTTLLLTAALGVAALLRKRKHSSPKS